MTTHQAIALQARRKASAVSTSEPDKTVSRTTSPTGVPVAGLRRVVEHVLYATDQSAGGDLVQLPGGDAGLTIDHRRARNGFGGMVR